jgi:hypothetical protein
MSRSLLVPAVALAVFVPCPASAQEEPYLQRGVPTHENAFELSVGTGYTQGFGMLRSGVGMPSVARAGLGVDLGATYRVDRRWAVGIGGQYQELYAPSAAGARGFSWTIAAQYHIDPEIRLDPWVELGSGYRLLWEEHSGSVPNVLTHGFELARARLGIDFRISPEVALSPVIGADATLFQWQDSGTISAIASPTVSTFVFAGLQGRIDVGGTQVGTTTVTDATPQ